jgi:hypothetical protein
VSIQYVMGYEIQSFTKSIYSDPPPKVSLHRMGGEASTYFTPEEARRFAEALLQAANDAEKAQ